MIQNKLRTKGYILGVFLLGNSLQGMASTGKTDGKHIVIGTVINRQPQLPTNIQIGTDKLAVKWEKTDASLFNTAFKQTEIKGEVNRKGTKDTVTAYVWALPENLVYLIDAGRIAPQSSQIFEAAKALRGQALLNDKPDQKYTSATDLWGYVEREQHENQKVYVKAGNEADWATSYLSDGKDKDEGLTYKLTLQPGRYKVWVAHVPNVKLNFTSYLRVNQKIYDTKQVSTTIAEDWVHPPVWVTHELKLAQPTTFTYESNKIGGKEWENGSISLIAVEQVSANVEPPFISPSGGDVWGSQTVELQHKDPSVEIYYTLDGSEPDKNSIKYSIPFTLNKTTRVNAIAYNTEGASKMTSADFAISTWAVTATPFKLVGENEVKNVKINWMQRNDADVYKIYRNGTLIGETRGDTYDDYGLSLGENYTYHVEGYKEGRKIAMSESQSAMPFRPSQDCDVYDNLNGQYLKNRKGGIAGMKIGNLYFSYRLERKKKNVSGQEKDGWLLSESYSKTGKEGSWSTPREIVFYPGVNFEGIGFRYNEKTGKVVLSAHYEDQGGYTAAKIFLAQITPKGGIEVGTMERPLGYDSRDQALFIDDDGTGYLLSATNMNSDINIYKLDETWTRPVALVNTICKGQHRETPSIIKKDGEYYFFSSKASGWYPSQAMYASAEKLDGVWTSLREIGNNSTFGAQFNNIQRRGTNHETFGVWSYHWGAQYHHKDPDGNFPRISVAKFNKGYASMDYYRYIEFYDSYGIVPVQNGRNLTLNAPASTTTVGANPHTASCITDGADMNSSVYFQSSTYPYVLTIDMQKKAKISELNLSTKLVNGSETAYKYTIEGSVDGEHFQTLVDGTDNWQVGFQILPVTDSSVYRYLRLTVLRIINVHNNNPAAWADGVYELTAFGTPVE
ncbi:FN3 associated domain-containing protein [Paraprevotella xylaniphila]|uniref:FN3 associated domain-containing protein n=1 Tax=Paraprevotella xylaniphila TaxID=454155 RepID=UPI0031F4E28D